MKDPLELYSYPEEWVEREAEKTGPDRVRSRIESGLYILTHRGWLKRGITTATTASASAIGAIASLFGESEKVEVWTPAGIYVEVGVKAKNGVAVAKKFSGDHSFDVTDGVEIRAEVSESLEFGEGIGRFRRKPAVSLSARNQILRNIEMTRAKYDYDGSVRITIPKGNALATLTDNPRIGIKGGISILGTTGFVEPWCDELVDAKVMIAKQYDRVVLTTGRKGWKWARENLKGFQPFVMGVYFEKALRELDGEIVIAGLPSLIIKWAIPEMRGKILRGIDPEKYRKTVLEKAREINSNVLDVILLRS
ncbi:cobalt-precorrin-5B (C(1))-methyltransferase [Geoglobus acetivorans]|uniref:Cobalt-precorrin-6 synthase, anaerobic n=1 Tax=Geoglobus acetivorans TaxID=565033 RepID=A0A0A7GG97_GEOAI|nr:Cobalt-precorrin-6 synthase, anaerobic [Geoglobus acetivorans]